MIDYVVREVIGRPVKVEVDTLVSFGLIDSLALVNILQYLEDVTRMRIPASKVQPKDMDTGINAGQRAESWQASQVITYR